MTLNERRRLFGASFNILANWLYDKGYNLHVDTDETNAFYREDKLICIDSRMGIEKRLYTLIHECGHLLIEDRWSAYAKKYLHAGVRGDGRKMRSAKYRVSIIEEEVEAWEKGYRLAKRLNLYIDEEGFVKDKTEALMSYFEWASKP